MSPYRLSLAFLAASSISLAAAPETPPASEKSSRGIWNSVLGGLKTAADGAGSVAKTAGGAVAKVFDFSKPKRAGLKLEVVRAPDPVRLDRAGVLPVRLQLFNTGKKTQLLEFTSVQRAEAVLRDGTGKIASRAAISTGEDASLVTVNPGERIEFLLGLPTKELVPGKTYILEAAITGQAGLVSRSPVRIAS